MKTFLIGLAFSLFLFPTWAQVVSNPWIRKPIFNMSAAFMEIENPTNKEVRLIKVEGPDAKYYEIHTHEKVDGVMKMRQIKKLSIPPKSKVILKPKSYHIMILEIDKKKIKNMEGILNLHFSNGEMVKIKAPIKEN